jgi:hypothetical protein
MATFDDRRLPKSQEGADEIMADIFSAALRRARFHRPRDAEAQRYETPHGPAARSGLSPEHQKEILADAPVSSVR